MTVNMKTVNAALVFHDSVVGNRWYDALGAGVVKYLQDFATLPSDDSTGDPTEFAVTVVEIGAGTSTAVITDQAGGALLITCAANEDDGWSMQLGAAAGESVLLDGAYPVYFGIKLQLNDVTQSDLFAGLAVTDTALLGGVTDGMYFRSIDGSTDLYFVLEKDSVESATAVHTLVDATDVIMEFLFDGDYVYVYIDGIEVAKVADTSTSFPDNEELRLSLEYLTGEAVANTCTVSWIRMIHIR